MAQIYQSVFNPKPNGHRKKISSILFRETIQNRPSSFSLFLIFFPPLFQLSQLFFPTPPLLTTTHRTNSGLLRLQDVGQWPRPRARACRDEDLIGGISQLRVREARTQVAERGGHVFDPVLVLLVVASCEDPDQNRRGQEPDPLVWWVRQFCFVFCFFCFVFFSSLLIGSVNMLSGLSLADNYGILFYEVK